MIGGVVEEATCEGKVSGLNPTGREARDFTRKKRDLPIIKIFFSVFKSRFCIFCKNISTGGSHNVELAHFYWPPAQTVLKNASRNKFPAACTVCLCTSVTRKIFESSFFNKFI